MSITKTSYHRAEILSSVTLTGKQLEYGFGVNPEGDHAVELTYCGKHICFFNAHAPKESIQAVANDLMAGCRWAGDSAVFEAIDNLDPHMTLGELADMRQEGKQ